MTCICKNITRKISALFIGVLALRPSAALAENNLTLKQCYEWARVQSEILKSRQEDIVQSKARARSALGGAFPHLYWQLTDTWQDTSGLPSFDDGSGSSVSLVDKNPVESKFSLRQPLFNGLREYSAYSAFKKQMARDELRAVREAADLYDTTAQAFYFVLSDQSELENNQTVLKLAEDRLVELKRNLRLGKSRESEIYSAQAQASSLRAQTGRVQGRLRSDKLALAFLTGREIADSDVLVDDVPVPTVGPLPDYEARLAQRSDIQAQREDMAAQKLRVRYEKGSYWPSADVTGNYYTHRPSFYENIDWDIMLFLSVPIYQGGSVSANVDAALASYRQSALTLELLERTAKRDLAQIHNNLTTALEEAQNLQEAFEASEKSYNSQRKEYGLGLVTNLEVIEALDTMQTQKRSWDNVRLAAKALYIRLLVTTEELP